jgi:hypothetical protein
MKKDSTPRVSIETSGLNTRELSFSDPVGFYGLEFVLSDLIMIQERVYKMSYVSSINIHNI